MYDLLSKMVQFLMVQAAHLSSPTLRHKEAASSPWGISHVAVNGVLVVEDGAFTGQTPGKVIRDFRD
jgi:hypothetical protein